MDPLFQIKLRVYPCWDNTPSETLMLECTEDDLISKAKEKVHLTADRLFEQLYYRDDEGEIVNFCSCGDLRNFTRRERKRKVYLVLNPERIFTPFTNEPQTEIDQVEENSDNRKTTTIQLKVFVKLNATVIKIIRFEHQLIGDSLANASELPKHCPVFKEVIARKLKLNPQLLTKLYFEMNGILYEFYNANFLVKLNDEKVKRIFVEYKPGALLKTKRKSVISEIPIARQNGGDEDENALPEIIEL